MSKVKARKRAKVCHYTPDTTFSDGFYNGLLVFMITVILGVSIILVLATTKQITTFQAAWIEVVLNQSAFVFLISSMIAIVASKMYEENPHGRYYSENDLKELLKNFLLALVATGGFFIGITSLKAEPENYDKVLEVKQIAIEKRQTDLLKLISRYAQDKKISIFESKVIQAYSERLEDEQARDQAIQSVLTSHA